MTRKYEDDEPVIESIEEMNKEDIEPVIDESIPGPKILDASVELNGVRLDLNVSLGNGLQNLGEPYDFQRNYLDLFTTKREKEFLNGALERLGTFIPQDGFRNYGEAEKYKEQLRLEAITLLGIKGYL
jgi:hypothetical protein